MGGKPTYGGKLPNVGYLALPFVIVPLLEIVLFVQVGDRIGVWPVVALVLVTGVVGFALARSQGFMVWRNAQAALGRGEVPGREIAHGAMVLFGAALLLTPGFITDGVGFLLMVPPVREWLRKRLVGRFSGRVGTRANVIDL